MPTDRELLKPLIVAAYPTAKAGAIPVWAGMIARFTQEMKFGDYVITQQG